MDQLINLNKHSHKEFIVKCDSKCSKKCREQYNIEFRRYLKVLKENNNKVVCIYCSRTSKFSGRSNPNTKYKSIKDNYFSKIDSPEKAYLLGWIASDGHISKRGFKISIHQKDIEILKIFQKFICREVPIRKFLSQSYTSLSKLCSYEINSKEISKDLCNLLRIKPGKKSDKVNFPQLNPKLQWDFLRGYFEGDGSINDPDIAKRKYPKGNIRSNSKSMLDSIKKVLDGRGSISEGMISLSNNHMMYLLDNIYVDNTLKLNRKYERYMKWNKIRSLRKK